MVSPGKAFALEKLRRGFWEAGKCSTFREISTGGYRRAPGPGRGGWKNAKNWRFLPPTPGGRILAGIPPRTNFTNSGGVYDFTIRREQVENTLSVPLILKRL